MQSCFHLDLALKLKGINIAMRGGGEGALRLLFRFGNRVLGGRGEISTECLNLFATACSRDLAPLERRQFVYNKPNDHHLGEQWRHGEVLGEVTPRS